MCSGAHLVTLTARISFSRAVIRRDSCSSLASTSDDTKAAAPCHTHTHKIKQIHTHVNSMCAFCRAVKRTAQGMKMKATCLTESSWTVSGVSCRVTLPCGARAAGRPCSSLATSSASLATCVPGRPGRDTITVYFPHETVQTRPCTYVNASVCVCACVCVCF